MSFAGYLMGVCVTAKYAVAHTGSLVDLPVNLSLRVVG